MSLTPELLASISAAVLSLALAYVPGLAGFYNGLGSDVKRLVVGALIVLSGIGAYAAAFNGLFGLIPPPEGVLGLIQIILAALMASQAVYLLLVKGRKK